jgi:hypothetical protein
VWQPDGTWVCEELADTGTGWTVVGTAMFEEVVEAVGEGYTLAP